MSESLQTLLHAFNLDRRGHQDCEITHTWAQIESVSLRRQLPLARPLGIMACHDDAARALVCQTPNTFPRRPDIYGPRTTCYNRFVRWRRAGVWDRIMEVLAAAHDATVQMIDT